MKSALLLLSGVTTSVVLLVGGLAVVQAALPDETPHQFTGLNNQPLWTSTPVAIPDRDTQDYERIEARLPADTVIVASLPPESKPDLSSNTSTQALDHMVTSALEDDMPLAEGDISIGYAPEHLDWCHGKYRSYRPDDNTYLSYSGARRTCVSPFDTVESDGGLPVADAGQTTSDASNSSMDIYEVSEGGQDMPHADPVAMQRCAERYQSYRAQDNTYQPYGGGPRRACEIRSF